MYILIECVNITLTTVRKKFEYNYCLLATSYVCRPIMSKYVPLKTKEIMNVESQVMQRSMGKQCHLYALLLKTSTLLF